MKNKVLVDTSSFIDCFRGGAENEVPGLALLDKIILSKVVRLELLKGTKRKDRKKLLVFLEGLHQIEEFPSVEDVEDILLRLHGRGLNVGLPDMMILSDAIRSSSFLLTADVPLREAARLLKVGLMNDRSKI